MKLLIALRYLICSGLILAPAVSWAGCAYVDPTTGPAAPSATFGNVIVQRDAPIGSVVATTAAQYTYVEYVCDNPFIEDYRPASLFSVESATTGVYNTNIAGIGIKYTNLTLPYLNPVAGGQHRILNTGPVNMQLVKTANTVGGVLTNGVVYQGVFYEQSAPTVKLPIFNTSLVGLNQVTVVACTIATPDIQVALAPVLGTEFTGVGSSPSGRDKDFSLGMDCDPGTNVNVTMSAVQNTDSATDGVLQLTDAGSAGVATGVGIQILNNGAPLQIGTRTLLKTSADGIQSFPFTARYYQTKSNVTAGSANTTAVFDVTYQ